MVAKNLTTGVGDLAHGKSVLVELGVKVVGHATVQGAYAEATGGKFKDGALVGAAMGAIGTLKLIGRIPVSDEAKRFTAAMVGGTVAEMGGGNFGNGASAGLMVYMYNDEKHPEESKKNIDKGFSITKGILDVQESVVDILTKSDDSVKPLSYLSNGISLFEIGHQINNNEYSDAIISVITLFSAHANVFFTAISPSKLGNDGYEICRDCNTQYGWKNPKMWQQKQPILTPRN